MPPVLTTFLNFVLREELTHHYQAVVLDHLSAEQMNHQLKMQRRFTRIGEMTRQETRNKATQSINKNYQTRNEMENRRKSFHDFQTRDAEGKPMYLPGQEHKISAGSCDILEMEENSNDNPKSTNKLSKALSHVFRGELSLQQFKIQSPRNMLRRSKSDQGDVRIKRHALVDSFVGDIMF